MKQNIVDKILSAHLLSGEIKQGSEIGIKIDQTLTQDATGTMAYLALEAMGKPRVKTDISLAYIDHNMLQSGFENADDHRYIASVAKKYGVYYSSPGNGICHQVHLERFAVPGKTLIGSDSHTPTAGGLGMLAFGAGGMDVAAAMGGGAYYIEVPKVILVRLSGRLSAFVSAKDIALYLLKILSVKGGVGYVIEWGGEGVLTLSVPERATITNMGAELGATSSVFPSDERSFEFLKAQGRASDYTALSADEGASYDRIIDINLSELTPMIALPHMPDNVVPVSEVAGTKVTQVCLGSCTNSSLSDMLKAAALLRGKRIHPDVSMSVSPGSKQVLTMLSDCGALSDILASGARLLECACGPCIGMGFSPPSHGVSVRTFNRNFKGRSGTADAMVYLASPETAVLAALYGEITDPKSLSDDEIFIPYDVPDEYKADDSGIIAPCSPEDAKNVEIIRGPNIKPLPVFKKLPENIELNLALAVRDNITTDHIMPAGAKVLPYRSNIEKLSEFCFTAIDPEFPARASMFDNSYILAGYNYGQGSSREHAALVPMYLGVRAVIAKSFARIHEANLINAGILPLILKDPNDYDKLLSCEKINANNIPDAIKKGRLSIITDAGEIELLCDFSDRQKDMLLAGGLLNYIGGLKNE